MKERRSAGPNKDSLTCAWLCCTHPSSLLLRPVCIKHVLFDEQHLSLARAVARHVEHVVHLKLGVVLEETHWQYQVSGGVGEAAGGKRNKKENKSLRSAQRTCAQEGGGGRAWRSHAALKCIIGEVGRHASWPHLVSDESKHLVCIAWVWANGVKVLVGWPEGESAPIVCGHVEARCCIKVAVAKVLGLAWRGERKDPRGILCLHAIDLYNGPLDALAQRVVASKVAAAVQIRCLSLLVPHNQRNNLLKEGGPAMHGVSG